VELVTAIRPSPKWLYYDNNAIHYSCVSLLYVISSIHNTFYLGIFERTYTCYMIIFSQWTIVNRHHSYLHHITVSSWILAIFITGAIVRLTTYFQNTLSIVWPSQLKMIPPAMEHRKQKFCFKIEDTCRYSWYEKKSERYWS